MTQEEAAAVAGFHLEVAVRGVAPAIEDCCHGEAASAEVEHMGLGFATLAGTPVHADLHDALFHFGRFDASPRPRCMRHPADAARYLAMALASAVAALALGTECCKAQTASAAASSRRLAKFTGFMLVIQPAGA